MENLSLSIVITLEADGGFAVAVDGHRQRCASRHAADLAARAAISDWSKRLDRAAKEGKP